MAVDPKSLVAIIDKNKEKKLIATKIIETNPNALSIVPKLIRDKNISSNIEEDNFSVNRAILEDVYNRIKSVKQNNKHIIKLFPDIELAIQILVSSILSPKKMTDIQLNYKLHKKMVISPTVSGELLELIKNYINEEYELEDKLPEIIREALFDSGAFVYTIIPESSVDDLINTDLLPNYATEDFKNRVDYLIDNLTRPNNIIVTSRRDEPEISLENKADKNLFVKYITSNSFINVTDNTGILKFNEIKEKISGKIIRNATRTRTAISQETIDKISYMDIFRQKNSSISNKNIEFIKTKDHTSRKSIGKPMISKIPTESIIPVIIPGNETEHVAYFILLDESGKPLNTDLKDSNVNDINSLLHQNTQSQQSPIQKAYANLIADSNTGVNINELFELYKDVLEKQLYDSIKGSLYNNNVEIAGKNDIYFLMFTRALAEQKTNILFIPKDLVTYFAFYYSETGVGKSLLENLTILSSLRAIILFAKVMAYAKQSIDVTKVNISLDPHDPDPEKTIEQVQDSVLKLRQNFLPLGISNPTDLVNWIQRAGLQFGYENNPLLPNVKIDFENANLTHTIPSSELEEDLRKQMIIALGLPPETIDSGFTPEFATTVVNNNVLLSKRIGVYQKTASKHLKKFSGTLLINDEELRTIVRKYILEHMSQIEESISEDEKKLLTQDKAAFIDYFIDQIADNLIIELPKPDNTNITNLSAEYETYKTNLENTLDSVISTDIFSEDIAGELSNHIDTIKNIYKNHLLRKWMADNNYYPEILEISSDNLEEIDATLDIISGHLKYTMRNSDKLIKMLQEVKEAVNKDLENVEGSGGTSSSSSSSSDSSSSDSSSDGGEDFGTDLFGDGGSDTSTDLDLLGSGSSGE